MKNKFVAKILLGLFALAVLTVFKSVPQTIDSGLSDFINKISSERKPDSSIIIIHIDSEDIEQLGPWPIKRSYYALLINNLNKFQVKKIGLEVFLSAKFITQGIYDNVLMKEIIKANNVVLSSLAGSLNNNKEIFTTDSLSLPSLKLLDENILTGHINYINEYSTAIPLKIYNQGKTEKAFCLQLVNTKKEYPNKIEINFITSWKSFTQYSLIEFFQLVQNNDPKLKLFKDKTVLIGVSDPQLSSSIRSVYNDKLPGVALHAFALDNLLNQRYLDNSYYFLSKFIFTLILFIIIFLMRSAVTIFRYYILVFLISIVLFFILNSYFFFQLAYSFLFSPLIILLFTDIFYNLIHSRHQLKGYYNEAALLKNLLTEKEKELIKLQKDFNLSSEHNSSQLLEKIKDLKDNIARLRENEDDKKVAEITSELHDVNFQGLVYKSKVMKSVAELIQKAAPTDATILITGESGTGKELVAKAIHSLSKRSDAKFVAVNCAALTESLLESELFGHVKGAFTGADSDKAGKFESANKGTIFLDEIGETSENFQVKLLRVIQSGEYDKVGSTDLSITNVRVISATNKNLKQLVNEHKFREDLFYRLNVINIHLPTLRERKEDIEPIARYFLGCDDKKYQMSLSVLKALNEYDWRGNIRELESVIKRAKVFCDSSERDLIQLIDLPDDLIRSIKLSFEDLVIESLRNKYFSHSSINETAKELGNVNRTLVSENFRGMSLKILVQNNFDGNKTIRAITNSEDQEMIAKVKSKLETWISNLKKEIENHDFKDFTEAKLKLSPKYKNLPQKYHVYLDEVIKFLLRQQNDFIT